MPKAIRTHAELIDALGGSVALATMIRRKTGAHVSRAAVGMWKSRHISWRWRATVAEIAQEKGIPVPSQFTLA